MTDHDEPIADPALHKEPVFVDPRLLAQAEQLCLRQLATNPGNRAVRRALAEVHRKTGNLTAASVEYDRLFAEDPTDVEAAYLGALLGGRRTLQPPSGLHPAPFVLVKDFLPTDFHDSLIPFATANRAKFVPSRVGRRAEYKPDVRQTLEFNEYWEGGPRFREHLALIEAIYERLHLTPFPGHVSAIRLRAYQDGHFFRVHIDAEPNTPSGNRVFNFVYFFHRTPRPYSGGELLLFDTDTTLTTFTRSRFTKVVPEDNSIILFPCTYFHSVLPVHCPSGEFADSRFVINGHVSRETGAGSGSDPMAESFMPAPA